MSDNEMFESSPGGSTPRGSIVRVRHDTTLPPITNTHMLARTIINPPGPPNKDRGGPDQDRYKERNKPSKDKLPDIIKNNPIFDDKGKVKVPIDGGYEPRWRPGRDGRGRDGAGGGKSGEDETDIVYGEMTYEEFLRLFFDGMELPFMLRKMLTETEVKTHKRRGITNNGPRSRLNKMETARTRLKRAIVMKNTHPEEFTPDFEEQCQSVFESYLFYAARASKVDSLVEQPSYEVLDEVKFLAEVSACNDQVAGKELEFRTALLLAAALSLKTSEVDGVARVSYRLNELVEERIGNYVKEQIRQGGDIPGVEAVPFHKSDLKFGRVEERNEPDSKAVAFLILDRSGSMDGDPIAIAKAFFLLNILFLRAKYKNVAIVMIAHDSHAERIGEEGKFYKIDAGGGTVAVPAWKMTLEIAEAEFSTGGWNRYMFHATDGILFDGESTIAGWWTKIVESPFNYCGYLEIITNGFDEYSAWADGGQALLTLNPAVAAHVGMACVSSLADLPRAFREILDKDRVKS